MVVHLAKHDGNWHGQEPNGVKQVKGQVKGPLLRIMFDGEEDRIGEPEPAEEFERDEEIAGDGVVAIDDAPGVEGHRLVDETGDGSEQITARAVVGKVRVADRYAQDYMLYTLWLTP